MNKNIVELKRLDGQIYKVRKDRHRYFFPDEWNSFIKTIKNEKHKLLFDTLLNTGARIMEALHIKPEDFDWDRGTITIRVVKSRKAKKRFYSLGKKRTFFVASNYLKESKSYIKKNNLNKSDFIFLNNKNIPEGYDNLDNKEKKKYFWSEKVSYGVLFKRKLEKSGIENIEDFSLHNIRKTYGNWMRIFNIELIEICFRMGHDQITFMEHYGSSLLFGAEEKREIIKILGDVK